MVLLNDAVSLLCGKHRDGGNGVVNNVGGLHHVSDTYATECMGFKIVRLREGMTQFHWAVLINGKQVPH